MYYVGIDVAKQTHYAAVMNSDGEILVSPFPFSNNHTGFQLLLDNLSEFSKEEILIGMESTAHYAENLTCFLYSRDFNVCIINPIQTSTLRKTNIRKTKTDSVDTYLIIKALIMNQYRLFSERDYDSLQLKNLCRFRQKLMKARTKVKIQLVTYVDLLSPVFTERLVMNYSKQNQIPTRLRKCISQGLRTFSTSPQRDTLTSLMLYF